MYVRSLPVAVTDLLVLLDLGHEAFVWSGLGGSAFVNNYSLCILHHFLVWVDFNFV